MIKLIGQKEIERNLLKSIDVVSKTITEAYNEVGQRGVGITKLNTPEITGRLRNSLSYSIDGKVTAPLGGAGRDILRVNNAIPT